MDLAYKLKKSHRMKTIRSLGISIALFSLLLGSCKKDSETGSLSVRMTDFPASYQQVNVEILKVRVHMGGGAGSWIDLPTKQGIYNLLTLQNGIDTTIVNTTELPAGNITQMRLLLGSNNTLMVNDTIYPMSVPSGNETGIKLVGNIAIPGNTTVNVLLDFVANESIVENGNGTYQLKPAVKVIN